MFKDTQHLDELLEKLNPFRIKGDDGRYVTFGDYGKCYYFVITFIYNHFKSGYVDMVLLVHMLTQMSLKDAERFVKKMRMPYCECDYFLIPWDDPAQNPYKSVEVLLRSLQEMTSTLFVPDYFRWAWDEFERQKVFEN